jgi:hypothetical protein
MIIGDGLNVQNVVQMGIGGSTRSVLGANPKKFTDL